MIMNNSKIIDKDFLFFFDQKNINQKNGTLKEMEKEMIKKFLIQNHGNRTKTALNLGISRRNLQLKIKEYKIDIPSKNI